MKAIVRANVIFECELDDYKKYLISSYCEEHNLTDKTAIECLFNKIERYDFGLFEKSEIISCSLEDVIEVIK